MNRLFFTISLILSLMFVNGLTLANMQDIKKEAGFISLNKSITKEVSPNIAKITFAVENTAQTAQKASTDNNEISNKIIEALKKVTHADSDIIKTTGFAIRPVYSNTKTGQRVIKNYTAVNSVSVVTKDITKVSSLIDTAILSGANRTEGLSYTYENDKSICDEQYPILLNDLRKQADILAKAAGTSVDGIKQIGVSCSTDSVVSNGRFFAPKAMMTTDSAIEEAAPSTPVEAGKIKVRIYVNADFYVK